MEQFPSELQAHGWPSFRKAEVNKGNVVTKAGGEVVSRCGTHLGHGLSGACGTRRYIELTCVAGSA